MIYKIGKYIDKHSLLKNGDNVIVGLSGGADSVALLISLLKLGYHCEAMHCNFHLRAEESDRDELFTRELCDRLGVKLHVVHFDTSGYAKENGISIEMAARELRYNAFEKQRKVSGAQAIAVAHHRDDSAETLLLNIVRGTGIRGMHGIQPRNGHIIRPLLCVGRKDILDYLEWRGADFVTDSTNLSSDYTRNKIRLEIIPKLAEINPSILESLSSTAERMSEAEKIYRNAIGQAIERVKNGNTIDIVALKVEVSPSTILHEILAPYGFNGTQTEEMAALLDGESGKQFTSKSHTVLKDRNSLIITDARIELMQPTTLPEDGDIPTPYGTLHIEKRDFDGTIPKVRNMACLDADTLVLPLTIRHTQNGDRFAPFGMHGTKLVSDYLTDLKKSLIEKQKQLVVTDATGKIVWVVNERPASPYCIKKDTGRIICLEWRIPGE